MSEQCVLGKNGAAKSINYPGNEVVYFITFIMLLPLMSHQAIYRATISWQFPIQIFIHICVFSSLGASELQFEDLLSLCRSVHFVYSAADCPQGACKMLPCVTWLLSIRNDCSNTNLRIRRHTQTPPMQQQSRRQTWRKRSTGLRHTVETRSRAVCTGQITHLELHRSPLSIQIH